MMTSADVASLESEDAFDSVEPKPSSSRTDEHSATQRLRQKAFVPTTLPEDFLRVVLNADQLNVSNDESLAHRLQYSLIGDHPSSRMMTPVDIQHERARQLQQSMGRGKLQINVVEARLAKNYAFTRMDPYVRLKLGSKVFETPTDYRGNKNPKWDKAIACFLPHNVNMLAIEIFDEKSFSTDELIAYAQFELPVLLFEGVLIDEWIPLSGKCGEEKEGHINVQMLFTPHERIRAAYQRSASMNTPAPQEQRKIVTPPVASLPHESTSSSISSSTLAPQNATPHPQQQQQQTQPQASSQSQQQQVESNQQQEEAADASNIEAGLESIREMFPSFDADVIKSILEANNGHKERTIEALLQMTVD